MNRSLRAFGFFEAMLGVCVVLLCLAAGCRERKALSRSKTEVSGVVVGPDGPQGGATVRVQTTDRFTTTDASGRFELDVSASGPDPIRITAWAERYFCSGPVTARAGEAALRIELRPIPSGDNEAYAWVAAESLDGEDENQGCVACHSRADDLPYPLPVDDWRADAHSASARNPRFRSMYLGANLAGVKSSPTRHFAHPDYGTVPIPPPGDEPYSGPGYKLDFPETAGNCAACHVPVAAVNAPHEADPIAVDGAAAEGVTCDFCHKVSAVVSDPSTGLPYPDRPGVLSFRFQRPSAGHQFFAGPFDDVAPGDDTFSALQRESLSCAPCHFATFWGTEIYGSFREWLESPYSDRDTGKTCQDCHMPPSGAEYFARPDQGGLHRPNTLIGGHRMPGASDRELLRNAVSMHMQVRRSREQLSVTVEITNDQTGHHVPTDSPLRHLILLIGATGADGRDLEQSAGSKLPDWAGVGDPAEGHYAGLPGKAFAKVLEEEWTHIQPSGAYWNPTRIVSDNRIAAMAADRTTVVFKVEGEGPITVEAKLLFRRAFRKLAVQKGWTDADIIMEEQSAIVAGP